LRTILDQPGVGHRRLNVATSTATNSPLPRIDLHGRAHASPQRHVFQGRNRSGCAPGYPLLTTLTQLPDAFWAGNTANSAPLAGLNVSTWPSHCESGNASTRTTTGCPARNTPTCVSFKFASTQRSSARTKEKSGTPRRAKVPTCGTFGDATGDRRIHLGVCKPQLRRLQRGARLAHFRVSIDRPAERRAEPHFQLLDRLMNDFDLRTRLHRIVFGGIVLGGRGGLPSTTRADVAIRAP
jgi:hypothetical protein